MSNYAAYFAIEKKMKTQGMEVSRDEVISKFTNGRKSGLSQLSDWEYAELLRWMNRTFVSKADEKELESLKKDKMRKKVIAILCKMGYKTPAGLADMPRIHAWATKYGVAHKHMNGCSYKELTQLVTQAEKALDKFIKGL